jgi:hypothetical protein
MEKHKLLQVARENFDLLQGIMAIVIWHILHISITIIQNLLITTNSAPNPLTSVHRKLGMKNVS